MANKKYMFLPDNKMLKQGFYLKDESENVIYEAKMIKRSLFKGMKYEFVNHITNKTEEHMVGNPVTQSTSTNGMTSVFSVKSYFKYDGKNIWDYLHDLGIRIDSELNGNKIGMKYIVTLKGEPLATCEMSNPKGGKLITSKFVYEVTTEEKDLDLAFLVTFAFAKTSDQTFYD